MNIPQILREVHLADIVRGEHDENAVRKDFLPSEAVAILRAILPAEKEAARERQRTLNNPSPVSEFFGDIETASENFSTAVSARALDNVASVVGVSRPTLTKATAIVEAAVAGSVIYV